MDAALSGTAGPTGADTVLSEPEAEQYINGICFKTGPPTRVGVELEWLVRDRGDPSSTVASERVDPVLAPLYAADGLPGGSRLTREPGGQLELSSAPGESLGDCLNRTAADLELLRAALARGGAVLHGRGLDPYRTPPRVLDSPRYRAMEAHFDRGGPWGRVMMRATAALQISLDAGDDSEGPTGYRQRWLLAHRLGPVLVAAFANSPVWRGRPTGWASTRQSIWARMDPPRTRPAHHLPTDRAPADRSPSGRSPAGHVPRSSACPREQWTRYALDASLLCLLGRPEDGGGADWAAPPRLTFRDWLRGRGGIRPPTRADLDYHLGTLFPPVRPRGWMELRMIDAQYGDGWIAAAAVTATLLDDPYAAGAAHRALEGLDSSDLWLRAARLGPADPELGPAVRACVAAAELALARSEPGGTAHRAVAEFAERYSERGRCPADDCLDRLTGARR
ncbi:ergothioneine biosynthesis glutamate--cysteine ligase EgtA [Streptomyces sp. XM4193]|uniref:ergothioneine biosynthesis glutamate--cysteine ligase EgtA n=1 Tax=Streptomyces sp. XM4193 TaxID=2929782 RepID=UPI001FFB38A9|nr:ergothioneine biosynthesis glutamate--cysteine ligase EgtA [Streptomyces sp. XM4193]MCK1798349.1 ergothioneine biosynthesis glutamate--cysteine ligase EgtA [Streptomyces sp. XM4193]